MPMRDMLTLNNGYERRGRVDEDAKSDMNQELRDVPTVTSGGVKSERLLYFYTHRPSWIN